MSDFDTRLYEYRLDEVSSDVKELRTEMKSLNEKLDDKFDQITGIIIKIQEQQCQQILEKQKLKQNERIETKKSKTAVVTAAISAVTAFLVAILTKLI